MGMIITYLILFREKFKVMLFKPKNLKMIPSIIIIYNYHYLYL